MSAKDRAPFRAIPSSSIKGDQDKDLYLVYINKTVQTVKGHFEFVGEPLKDVVSKDFLYYARMTAQQLAKVRSDPGVFFVHQVTLERAERALESRGATSIRNPFPDDQNMQFFKLVDGASIIEVFDRVGFFVPHKFLEKDQTYHVQRLTEEQYTAMMNDPAVLLSGAY